MFGVVVRVMGSIIVGYFLIQGRLYAKFKASEGQLTLKGRPEGLRPRLLGSYPCGGSS